MLLPEAPISIQNQLCPPENFEHHTQSDVAVEGINSKETILFIRTVQTWLVARFLEWRQFSVRLRNTVMERLRSDRNVSINDSTKFIKYLLLFDCLSLSAGVLMMTRCLLLLELELSNGTMETIW